MKPYYEIRELVDRDVFEEIINDAGLSLEDFHQYNAYMFEYGMMKDKLDGQDKYIGKKIFSLPDLNERLERMVKPLREIMEKEGNGKLFLYKGFPCFVYRNYLQGFRQLNGYVIIPSHSHLATINDKDKLITFLVEKIETHYDITYAHTEFEPEHHNNLPELEKYRGCMIIGFDTAHSGDLSPEELTYRLKGRHLTVLILSKIFNSIHDRAGDTYKGLPYVTWYIHSMVEQLRKYEFMMMYDRRRFVRLVNKVYKENSE